MHKLPTQRLVGLRNIKAKCETNVKTISLESRTNTTIYSLVHINQKYGRQNETQTTIIHCSITQKSGRTNELSVEWKWKDCV